MKGKIMKSSNSLYVVAMFGVVTAAWGQFGLGHMPANLDPATQKQVQLDFLKLREKQSKLNNEAEKQVHLKHYAYAEQLCQQAIDLTACAPFAQAPSKQELAQVYLAEGLYKRALKIWEPMFVPQDPLTEACCGMAIAYARLGKPEKGAEVLRVLYKDRYIEFKFLSNNGSPIDEELTPDSVEATAILMRVDAQPSQFEGDDEAALHRALALAPKNGCVLWKLGQYYFYEHGGWTRAKPYYAAAYRHGSKIIQEYSAGRFQSQGVPLPNQDHG